MGHNENCELSKTCNWTVLKLSGNSGNREIDNLVTPITHQSGFLIIDPVSRLQFGCVHETPSPVAFLIKDYSVFQMSLGQGAQPQTLKMGPQLRLSQVAH